MVFFESTGQFNISRIIKRSYKFYKNYKNVKKFENSSLFFGGTVYEEKRSTGIDFSNFNTIFSRFFALRKIQHSI